MQSTCAGLSRAAGGHLAQEERAKKGTWNESYKSLIIRIGDMMQQWRACKLGCETYDLPFCGVLNRNVRDAIASYA